MTYPLYILYLPRLILWGMMLPVISILFLFLFFGAKVAGEKPSFIEWFSPLLKLTIDIFLGKWDEKINA